MAPRASLEKRPITALGVVAPPPIQVQTPTFDGSLGLLFECARDRRIDLMTIPLAPICEAYFLYLLQSPQVELDEAAAALAALAYLLERKAWGLLPTIEEEPEMAEPLEAPSPTVRLYESAIEALNLFAEERAKSFFRTFESGPDPYEVPYSLEKVSAADLATAFERVLSRANPDAFEPLGAPRRSLQEQMAIVMKALAKDWLALDLLVPREITRSEAVYWFLALLELVRLGQVMVRTAEADVEFARGQAA